MVHGYDPGEVWTGVASLYFAPDDGFITMDAAVLCSQGLPFAEHVNRVTGSTRLPHRALCKHVHVIESFQARPKGFNSFSAMETVQMIGALRYALGHSTVTFIRPGDAEKELPLLIGDRLDAWQFAAGRVCERKEWNHARSAIRVLLRYLVEENSTVFAHLRCAKPAKHSPASIARFEDNDLAPRLTPRWIL